MGFFYSGRLCLCFLKLRSCISYVVAAQQIIPKPSSLKQHTFLSQRFVVRGLAVGSLGPLLHCSARGCSEALAQGLRSRLKARVGKQPFPNSPVVAASTEFFTGCCAEAACSFLPQGSLPLGSLHYESVQGGKTVEGICQQDGGHSLF